MSETTIKRSWMPGVKTWSLVATVLVLVALYVAVWWTFQQRVALIRDIGATGGQVTVKQRGPEWLRSLTGYGSPHGVSVYPSYGILDRVEQVRFDRRVKDRAAARQLIPRMQLFTSLAALKFQYETATDDDLVAVSELKSLNYVALDHCRVSGRGFARLKQLPRLESVGLSYTPIRDEALEHLQGIPTLKWVGVWGCRHLTPTAVADFERARPDVELAGRSHLDQVWAEEKRKAAQR